MIVEVIRPHQAISDTSVSRSPLEGPIHRVPYHHPPTHHYEMLSLESDVCLAGRDEDSVSDALPERKTMDCQI